MENYFAQASTIPDKACILRRKDMAKIFGCSTSTLHKLIAEGKLPKPRKLGQRISYWTWADIDPFLNPSNDK